MTDTQEEPVGGAARLATLFKQHSNAHPLVLFSGDAFNPSVVSTIEKGHQMAPVLKALGVHCAVLGNHEFDFGVDELLDICKEGKFPWLMSNVIDNFTSRPLGGGETYMITDCAEKKIGLIGLVEEEWLETLPTVDHEDVTYTDYVTTSRELSSKLKEQHMVDVVIALTHMRWSSDIRLAENVQDIDLILGGHDHDYDIKEVNGIFIIKSGTDFQTASKIELSFLEDNKIDVQITKMVADKSVSEDPTVKRLIQSYLDKVTEKMNVTIGQIDVDLDGRFSKIRTMETNLGNFVTDAVLTVLEADMAILNSGTFRSNRIHRKGEFKLLDLRTILPMFDNLVVLQMKGHQLMAALENAVSQYPNFDGRFPQVSGLTFAFHTNKPPGKRVPLQFVRIQNACLDLDKTYRVATKQYLADGKDGYSIFKSCCRLNDDDGPVLPTVVQNYFTSIKIVKGEKQCASNHRQSVISLLQRSDVIRKSMLNLQPNQDKRKFVLERQRSVLGTERSHCRVAPAIEGRIVKIENDKALQELEQQRKQHQLPVLLYTTSCNAIDCSAAVQTDEDCCGHTN